MVAVKYDGRSVVVVGGGVVLLSVLFRKINYLQLNSSTFYGLTVLFQLGNSSPIAYFTH